MYAEMYEDNFINNKKNNNTLILAIVKRAEPVGVKVYKI